tara:strand:+ start:205 stop:831 length:627 start_codon:yes stop_codon:yes gene_type:complete
MKRDLFVTDLWEFDFPYHSQFKPQILDYLNRPESQEHINKASNPSLTSYGGDELNFKDDASLFSFFNLQIKRLLRKVEQDHEWEDGEWEDVDPWLNVNQKGNFNPPHIHPGNDYSGCYYITYPENSGVIHFLDPRPQHRFSSPNPAHKQGTNWYAGNNPYDSSIFSYEIKEGKVILFPSWLMHYVDPNPTDNLRISIAFNAKYAQYEC